MMQPKTRKAALWLAAILILLGLAAGIGWHFLKRDLEAPRSVVRPVLERQLPRIVQEATDSLYHISYSDLQLDLKAGRFTVTGLKILPDEAVFRRMIREGRAPNDLIRFTADRVALSGGTLQQTGQGRSLTARRLEVVRPFLRVVNKRRLHTDTAKSESHSLFYQVVRSLFRQPDLKDIGPVRIDQIALVQVNAAFVNQNEAAEKTTWLRRLDMEIDGFSVTGNPDSAGHKAIVVQADNYRILTADKLYHVDMKGLAFRSLPGSLYIRSLHIRPRFSEQAFRKATRKANTRYDLLFTGIALNGIDVDRLIRQQQIHVRQAHIAGSRHDIYTNYNWPLRTPPPRRNHYPHELLQRLAFDITVDRMTMAHGALTYRIVGSKSDQESRFVMEATEGTFYHITNNTAAKKENPYARNVMQSIVMGAGRLQADFRFNLADPKAPYTVTATLGPMAGQALNPVTVPLALIELRAGQLQRMELQLRADEYTAKGNIDLYYQDLKVRVLKGSVDTTLKRLPLVSFLANRILPDANPRRGGKFSKGPINIIRDGRESFFGFLWRALLDGATSSVMGTNQQKETPRNIVTRLSKIVAGPKEGQEYRSTGNDRKRIRKK